MNETAGTLRAHRQSSGHVSTLSSSTCATEHVGEDEGLNQFVVSARLFAMRGLIDAGRSKCDITAERN